jgi:hypothetical protein
MSALTTISVPVTSSPVTSHFLSCRSGPMPSTFQMPAECSNLWNVTTSTYSETYSETYSAWNSEFPTAIVISYRFYPASAGFWDYSDVYNNYDPIKEHQSCLPAAVRSTCQFDFLDANCPDGWTAFSLGKVSSTIKEVCCPR